jgi:hypothetical protein
MMVFYKEQYNCHSNYLSKINTGLIIGPQNIKIFAENKLRNGYQILCIEIQIISPKTAPSLCHHPPYLHDLHTLITAAVALVDRDMLTRVWDEMDYRIDICRITKGGHIEHL